MSNGVLTQETVVREDPYTEAYKRGLFESVFGLVNQQMGFEQVPTGQYDAAGNPIVETRPIMDGGRPVGPAYAPTQQVAGMSPMQQQARALLQENLGAGQDYLRGGLGSVMRGGQLYEQAAQQAMPVLRLLILTVSNSVPLRLLKAAWKRLTLLV
jgi:hypothetical protein